MYLSLIIKRTQDVIPIVILKWLYYKHLYIIGEIIKITKTINTKVFLNKYSQAIITIRYEVCQW